MPAEGRVQIGFHEVEAELLAVRAGHHNGCLARVHAQDLVELFDGRLSPQEP